MIELFNRKTGEKIGAIDEEQFDFIIDHLEDETGERTTYTITRQALTFLEERGLAQAVVDLLAGALGKAQKLDFEYHIDDEIEFDYDEEEEE